MKYMEGITALEQAAIWAVFLIAWLGLAYALFLRSQILREDKGTEKMQEVWNAIKDGANAYLQKQLRSILAVNRRIDCCTFPVCLYCSALA